MMKMKDLTIKDHVMKDLSMKDLVMMVIRNVNILDLKNIMIIVG